MEDRSLDFLKTYIRLVPDFPKPGIQFLDIGPLLRDAKVFNFAVENLARRADLCDGFNAGFGNRLVAGIESRGFIFGAAMAQKVGLGFVPVRKVGKLPGKTIRQDYCLEYGKDTIEIQTVAITPATEVVVVDDVLATGGTAEAACRLVEKAGGKVLAFAALIAIDSLNGEKRLKDAGIRVEALLRY